MDNSDIGKRMKTYEKVSRTKLVRRTPVAIRIDGRAFHTFTKGFRRPFDDILIETMQETTKYLCENIQGCIFGYTQSDEITLILKDYETFETEAWFDNQVQKMCSISASMATMKFNQIFKEKVDNFYKSSDASPSDLVYGESLDRAVKQGAMFDSRVFNIPKEEVVNLVYWRQLDASRNSIQMVGQANFSHSELQNKSCEQIQDMLFKEKNINWNDLPIYKKRGSAVIKENFGVTYKAKWIIDKEMPILKGIERDYLEVLI